MFGAMSVEKKQASALCSDAGVLPRGKDKTRKGYDSMSEKTVLQDAEYLLESLRYELNKAIDQKSSGESAWRFAKKRYEMQQRVVQELSKMEKAEDNL